jgi:hypothetical protein
MRSSAVRQACAPSSSRTHAPLERGASCDDDIALRIRSQTKMLDVWFGFVAILFCAMSLSALARARWTRRLPALEVIVVDDRSTDGAADVLRRARVKQLLGI